MERDSSRRMLRPRAGWPIRLVCMLVAWVLFALASAANPQVPPGGTATFASTGTTAPTTGTWDVLNSSGTQIATSVTPAGWTVSYAGTNFTVGAPSTATVAVNYKVRFATGPVSATFDVVPVVIAMAEVLRPAWAESNIPKDESSSGGDGPSSADYTDLASGVQTHSPPPDIVVANPVGPSVAYRRTYRTSRALANYYTPGLPVGWYDNYAYYFQASTAVAWNALALKHPNGSGESFSPTLSSGTPTGAFSKPTGAPYVLVGVPGTTAGTWTSLTLKFRDLTQWVFLPSGSARYRLSQIKDSSGNSVTLNRDTTGRLTSITNSAGTALLTFQYYGSALVKSITDPNGRRVTYTIATVLGANNLTKVSQVVPSTVTTPPSKWEYGYTLVQGKPFLETVWGLDASNPGVLTSHPIYYNAPSGRAVGGTDANGNVRSYTYRTGETDVTLRNGSGGVALFYTQLHGSGKFTGLRDANGKTTTVSYGDLNNPALPTNTINRNSQSVGMTYDVFGNLKTFTDSRGVVTTNTYDYTIWPTGLLVQSQEAGKTATNYEYYPSGYLKRVLTPKPGTSNTGQQVVSKEYTYTTLGNVATVKVLNSTGVQVTYTYGYVTDGSYATAEKIGQPITLTDPLGKITHYRYDAVGRLITQADAVGNSTDYSYNTRDQLTRITHPATGQTGSLRGYTEYVYDAPGGTLKVVREVNEAGATTYEETLAHGKEAESKGSSGTLETVQTIRDGIYRVAGVKNGNNKTTSYGFDAIGNTTSKVYPLGDGSSVQVDFEGNVTQRTDGRGRVTNYTLATDDSRPTNVLYASDSSRNATLGYDGFSRLTTVADHTGTVVYAYDDLDNVTSVTTTFTGLTGTYVVSYAYNDDNSRASMTTPKGTYAYSYDNNGRITRVTAPWTGGITDYAYFDNGWLKQQKNPRFLTDITYNGRGFVTSYTTNSRDATPILRVKYSNMLYDAFGNLKSATIDIPAVGLAASASGSLTLNLDGFLRPTGESRVLSSGASLYNYTFTIDNAGNPTSARGVSRPVNDNSQVTGSGFTYDGEGNPTNYAGTAFAWDNENRPLSVGGLLTQEFRVDGDRAWKTNPIGKRTYYLYDGDQVICEIAGANSSIAAGLVYGAYAYGPLGMSTRYNGVVTNGEYTAFVWDPFGNPVMRQRQYSSSGPNDICVYDSRGFIIADKNTNASGSLPVTDPVGGLGQFGDLTDEELKGGGLASGLQLLTGGGYYDPTSGRYVNRFGSIENEYRAETLPWRITSSLARGAINGWFGAMADVADFTSDLENVGSFGQVNLGHVPQGWRQPLQSSNDPLEKACEVNGQFTSQMLGTIGMARGIRRAGLATEEEGVWAHSAGMRRSSIARSHWRMRAKMEGAVEDWGELNVTRMRRGLAPLVRNESNGLYYPMDLAHEPVRFSEGGTRYRELPPWVHAARDKFRGMPRGRMNP